MWTDYRSNISFLLQMQARILGLTKTQNFEIGTPLLQRSAGRVLLCPRAICSWGGLDDVSNYGQGDDRGSCRRGMVEPDGPEYSQWAWLRSQGATYNSEWKISQRTKASSATSVSCMTMLYVDIYHRRYKIITTRKAVVARRYLRQGKAIRQVASPSLLCQRFPYAPFNAMITKISKWSKIQNSFWITPKIESLVAYAMPDIPSKFQKDPSITFWVILLTDKQTDKQKPAKT